jgi:hypothetical protein
VLLHCQTGAAATLVPVGCAAATAATQQSRRADLQELLSDGTSNAHNSDRRAICSLFSLNNCRSLPAPAAAAHQAGLCP